MRPRSVQQRHRRGAGVRQPHRRDLQPRRRRRPQPVGHHDRRRSSKARSPSGTTPPSSPTTRTPICPTPRSPRSTAPTTRARPRTSPTTSTRPRTAAGPQGASRPGRVKGGEAAEGTSGVVAAVTGGQGTIGYADESQAGDLGKVNVKVGDEFVAPTPEAAAKVLDTATPVEGRADTDIAVDVDRTTEAPGRLPDRPGLLPDRLPDVRRRGDRRPGQGLADLRRQPEGQARPPQPAPARLPSRTTSPPRSRPRSRRSPQHDPARVVLPSRSVTAHHPRAPSTLKGTAVTSTLTPRKRPPSSAPATASSPACRPARAS